MSPDNADGANSHLEASQPVPPRLRRSARRKHALAGVYYAGDPLLATANYMGNILTAQEMADLNSPF
jgi:hypothetical protein